MTICYIMLPRPAISLIIYDYISFQILSNVCCNTLLSWVSSPTCPPYLYNFKGVKFVQGMKLDWVDLDHVQLTAASSIYFNLL